MKKVLNPTLLVVVILFFSFCATMKLERGLSSDIKQWYEKHSIIMDGKVPAWIDESGPSECHHFLQLPEKIQREYIDLFWKIRHEGAKECFYSRIEYANRMFRERGKKGCETDRGIIYVLCGEPEIIQWYYKGEVVAPRIGMMELGYTQVWWYKKDVQNCYTFESDLNNWRRVYGRQDSSNFDLERLWKRFYAPTEDGWDLWASELLSYVKEKEAKEKAQNVIMQ